MEEVGVYYYTFRRQVWKITNDSDIKTLPIYLDRWGRWAVEFFLLLNDISSHIYNNT